MKIYRKLITKYLLQTVIACSIIFINGCGVVYHPNPVIQQYRMTESELYISAPLQQHACASRHKHAPSLQISSVLADTPFNARYMLYSKGNNELNSYVLHEWVTKPEDMLTQLMQEKLLNSCSFSTVSSSRSMTSANYRLNSQLINLTQTITTTTLESSSPEAHIAESTTPSFVPTMTTTAALELDMLVQLINNSNNQVVESKLFRIKLNVEPNVRGYISGANLAANIFLDELAKWIDHLKLRTTR